MEKDKNKKKIRKELKLKLSQITCEEVKEKSHVIIERICGLQEFQAAGTIFVYVSSGKEPETRPLIQKFADKKKIYVPRCLEENHLEAVHITSLNDLQPGKYGIFEPEPHCRESISGEDLSMTFVPGIAFDRRGFRLGRGKGYYDRCLKNSPHNSVWGLCFDFQFLNEVPHDEWDMKVNGVITENGIFRLS